MSCTALLVVPQPEPKQSEPKQYWLDTVCVTCGGTARVRAIPEQTFSRAKAWAVRFTAVPGNVVEQPGVCFDCMVDGYEPSALIY